MIVGRSGHDLVLLQNLPPVKFGPEGRPKIAAIAT
jgi:hypothetical protein